MFCCTLSVSAIEIESTKAVESINHVVPVSTPQTINNTVDQEEDFYSPEIELKGSVIYNEGASSIPEVELENVEKPKIKLKTSNMIIPVAEKNKPMSSSIQMPSRSAFADATRLKGEDYCLSPIWSQVRESVGNFSYGTEYFSYVDSAQLETSMNIYTRYDFKHFAITCGAGTNERRTEGANDNILKFAPEIKISKSFVIRDTVQAYVNNNVKKNRISIIYTPQIKNKPDLLWFELGFSNSFYTNGRVNSSVEFTTKIKL
jgi:hypothetical protein